MIDTNTVEPESSQDFCSLAPCKNEALQTSCGYIYYAGVMQGNA